MNKPHVLGSNHESTVFDPLKLHESLVSSCMCVRAHEGEAHSTAERVCKKVIDWLALKDEVTTGDIRRVASRHLATFHPEAAYMYQNLEMMV